MQSHPHQFTRREKIIFLGALGLALGLRLFTLGDRPFDGDEGVIGLAAAGNLANVFTIAAGDVHPPLYHLLVWGTVKLFGVAESTVRLVGVLAGVGLAWLMPRLSRALGVKWFWPTFLIAFNPFLINLSQDARMYSLLVFFVALSWTTLIELVDKAFATPRAKLSIQSWVYFGLAALGLVLTHHIGWLVLGLELGLLTFFQRDFLRAKWRSLLITLGALMLAYAPLIPVTLTQIQGRLAEQSLATGVVDRIKGVVGVFYRIVAGRTFLDLSPSSLKELFYTEPLAFTSFVISFMMIFLALAAGNMIFFQGDRNQVKWRLSILIFIGLSVLAALGIGSVAIQATRYLSYLTPFVLILLATGLVALWRLPTGKPIAVVIILVTLAGIQTQYFTHNASSGQREIARLLNAQVGSRDIVLLRGAFAGGERWAVQYYLGASASGAGMTIEDMYGSYRVGNLEKLRAVAPGSRIKELKESYERVWYLDRTYAEIDLTALTDWFKVSLVHLSGLDKEGFPLTIFLITDKEQV
ncbi:hypothetical protein HYW32_02155 [Candidatus Berkelbacteria bacterium]|nr:hypothetical protein [Candidatus Berkelbacteria bacterium]